MNNAKLLLQVMEGCRLKAYHGAADRPGIWTIGIGHVITGHEIDTHGIELFKTHQMMPDVTITQEQADLLFEKDYNKAKQGVLMRLNKEKASQLTENQLGALISLSFNIGLGGFSESRIRQEINNGNIKGAAEYFKSWTTSDGERQKALVRRRAAEKALYLEDLPMFAYFRDRGSDKVTIKEALKYLNLPLDFLD